MFFDRYINFLREGCDVAFGFRQNERILFDATDLEETRPDFGDFWNKNRVLTFSILRANDVSYDLSLPFNIISVVRTFPYLSSIYRKCHQYQ